MKKVGTLKHSFRPPLEFFLGGSSSETVCKGTAEGQQYREVEKIGLTKGCKESDLTEQLNNNNKVS